MTTTRRSAIRSLTIPDDVWAKLERLAAADAAKVGGNAERQKSATVCRLILEAPDPDPPKKTKK